ncbi:MAG: hypothetical protein JWL86_4424 [Rhizobium sp.]|nr:hypothetical protein [Rhizobium sp.]
MTASAEWHYDRLAIARASAGTVILVAAFVAYAVWAFLFLTDPATSWVHVESANGDAVVHSIMTQAWSSRWGEILKGVATDANSSRFRPISHLVEHYDAYLRHGIVARIGFIPALANFSSLVYFTACPMLAFLIARQILGVSAVGAALIALAIVALLTSTGYNSASIFIFRPAKKIIIFVTLAQILVAVWYMHVPRLRLVFALGALQFVAAMTDEVGLFSGILIPVLIVLVATPRHLAVLAAFWLLTALGFLYGASLRSASNFVAPPMSDALAAILNSEFYTSIAAHLAGSLSILYGPAIGKALWVAGIVLATVAALRAVRRRHDDRAAALTLIAVVLLLANAAVAALILTYGGSAYMSEHGYYYGSVLAVFGFFLTCAALGSGGVITRSLIAAALIVSIGSNLVQMPRMNHLIAVMHNNPYPIEAINRAGALALAGAPAVSMPVCSPAVIGASLDRDFATFGIDRSALYAHSPFPPAPAITDRFLPSVFGMMLRNPPRIQIESEKNGAC